MYDHSLATKVTSSKKRISVFNLLDQQDLNELETILNSSNCEILKKIEYPFEKSRAIYSQVEWIEYTIEKASIFDPEGEIHES